MLARHWGRNIPGNPNFVVQNMPGASGRRLMGHMQGIAPKDGTAIAAGHRALPFDPLMGVKAKFDPTKVTWIGNANDEVNICIVWHASPAKTFDDLRKHETVVGSGGPGQHRHDLSEHHERAVRHQIPRRRMATKRRRRPISRWSAARSTAVAA